MAGSLFSKSSLSSSACMLISAYIFFSRRFSSSRAFIGLIIDASKARENSTFEVHYSAGGLPPA